MSELLVIGLLLTLWFIASIVNWLLNEFARKPEDLICPSCGYYCFGDGGIDCIDKPKKVLESKDNE